MTASTYLTLERQADMGMLKDFLLLPRISGVAQYILVNRNGEVIIHNMKDYKNRGKLVSFCAGQAVRIGRDRLDYMEFSRQSGKHLFIFPVGNYSLGVIKQEDIQTVELVTGVLEFLNGLDIKRS